MYMQMLFKTQVVLFYGLLLSVSNACAAAKPLTELRDNFLRAERLIALHNNSDFIKESRPLKNYVLYPYLQYQWLSHNLDRERDVKKYLTTYHGSRYAQLLRNKWLYRLGQKKYWGALIKQYRSTSDVAIKCYYYRAKHARGSRQTALSAAKKLWEVGHSQPDNCEPLFEALKSSALFTPDLIWRRFQASLKKNNLRLASYIKGLMNEKDSQEAELWLKVHKNPLLVTQSPGWHRNHSHAGLLFASAVDRIAGKDPQLAVKTWDENKQHYLIPQQRVLQIERRLALSLAYNRDKQAFDRLDKLPHADEKVKSWQIRVALAHQDWQQVAKALNNLTSEEKQESHWQYWQARAYEEAEQHQLAQKIYAKLAIDRSFYGFLSSYRLDQDIYIHNQPLQVSEQDIDALENQTEFQIVKELRAIDRIDEATSQWWYAISKLNKAQITVAAKLAQRWQWDQIAIFTVAKAKSWDDVDLRFPVKYTQQVNLNAERNDLDPAIVFGLIRRESAFNENAHSPVGARGLMQIMPRTGRLIARKLQEKWDNVQSLYDPELNVKYGTFYYKQMLERFNGNYALAAAAYNAGPHRVINWLPENKPLAADIWIETIPFNETRNYVSAVLTYALIYQQRLNRDALKVKDFMRDILPG